MSISFSEIAVDIRTPGSYVEFDASRAVQGLPQVPHKALIIAQRLAAGTVAAEIPTHVPSAAAAVSYFGKGSYMAEMCAAFKLNNPYTELWAVALDDASGTPAAGVLTFTGPATAAGSIYLYIGGKRIVAAVANGAASTAVATAVAAAITAYHNSSVAGLPVSAVANSSTVELTARADGTLGNKIDLRFNYAQGEAFPAGIGGTVSTPMASGATDPDMADAIAAIGDTQYHTIASALADSTNMGLLEDELEARWGGMVQKEGHAFAGVVGSQGTLSSAGNARNSAFSTLMGGGLSPTSPWVWAAAAAGIDAAETSKDPARPRQTLALRGVSAPAEADRFTRVERNTLLTDGVSTFTVDNDGTVRIERLITTFQTNTGGFPDITFLDITTPRTLAYLRYTWRARIAQKYPRHKLANDGTRFAPGQAVVTPSIIKGEALAIFREWEAIGLVEGFEQFRDEIIVERNGTDPNRIDMRMSPDLLNQFMVLAGQIQFLL